MHFYHFWGGEVYENLHQGVGQQNFKLYLNIKSFKVYILAVHKANLPFLYSVKQNYTEFRFTRCAAIFGSFLVKSFYLLLNIM